MVTTSYSIDINMPMSRVFAYATDPSKIPEWQSNVLKADGEPGLPAGSFLAMDTNFLGRRSSFQIEMLENDGLGRTRARSIRGPVKFDTTYEYIELTPGSCRLSISVTIEAGVIYRLAEPALQSITHTILEADLKTLKTILEQVIT